MNYKVGYLVVSFSITTLLFSCTAKNEQENMSQVSALPTDFIQLKFENVDIPTAYPGSIEGQDNVEIKAQVNGYLEKVYVKEGQYVSQGQTLFRITPTIYEEQVKNSDASLKVALANLANTKLEVEKLKPLVEGNVVSDVQLKTAEANYQGALAQVAQAKAALGSSKINADFTYIKAPISGYIGRIPNRIGNLVGASDTNALTTLSNINTVNVYFSMNEAQFISYNRFINSSNNITNTIELLLADGSTYDNKGKLESASGNFDKNTGSIQLKAVFSNPNNLLRSGGTAKVILHQQVDNVIQVPKTAVKDIQDKLFIYKLDKNNKVKMLPIDISGGNTEFYFVNKGVKAGDKIAINRLDELTDNALVTPNNK